ncbi:phosphonate C-P lyase system protein PhnL [Rhizobium laguerreae]|uniref:phosphonate C-P lyase system protein PhnL n=1 Tax=Rhizobium laguerreae TaxID=1076926 RepID=UPI0010406EB1|nr:phosphonate C-P lyase system protein PhnL [Rhizobium laguerreae]TBX99054.1 phosphonate C-P lyase system protein PhnL [Rhizobium laguerreae]
MTREENVIVAVEDVGKQFTIHSRNQTRQVFSGASFTACAGECVVLDGPSGVGKSSLLRAIYGNYLATTGRISVRTRTGVLDVTNADPEDIIELRRSAISYVSQFLRALPRITAIDVVAEPLIALGVSRQEGRDRAAAMLSRLNLAESLWLLSPLTFSGGEQQRVNIARGFVAELPILLLDEPTASLDRNNRAVVVDLIREAVDRGGCAVGIFHDQEVRETLANRIVDMRDFAMAA